MHLYTTAAVASAMASPANQQPHQPNNSSRTTGAALLADSNKHRISTMFTTTAAAAADAKKKEKPEEKNNAALVVSAKFTNFMINGWSYLVKSGENSDLLLLSVLNLAARMINGECSTILIQNGNMIARTIGVLSQFSLVSQQRLSQFVCCFGLFDDPYLMRRVSYISKFVNFFPSCDTSEDAEKIAITNLGMPILSYSSSTMGSFRLTLAVPVTFVDGEAFTLFDNTDSSSIVSTQQQQQKYISCCHCRINVFLLPAATEGHPYAACYSSDAVTAAVSGGEYGEGCASGDLERLINYKLLKVLRKACIRNAKESKASVTSSVFF